MEEVNYCHERRKSPRLTVSIPASCIDAQNDNTIEALTHDISKEGVGLFTDTQLSVGTNLEIYLHMTDNGEIIATKGKVVWLASATEHKYRLGIQLDKPHLEPIQLTLRTIRSQVQSRFANKTPLY